MAIDKSTFCKYPFEGLFLRTNGDLAPCCAMQGTLGSIKDSESINDIMHNDIAKSMRTAILNNEWHNACEYCRTAEEKGQQSQRLHSFERYDELKDFVHEDYYKPRETDIRWNNICNLTCNYCGPHFSSAWAKIKEEYGYLNTKQQEQKVLEYLEENQDEIVVFSLLGGEPFLHKSNAILADKYPNKRFSILSNFSFNFDSNTIIKKFLKLKNVGWGVSCENIGKRHEYVRQGSSWVQFVDNIKKVYNVTKKKIHIFPTYNVYCALHLVEFYDFIFLNDYFDTVLWQGLIEPEELDISLQPKEIKDKAILQIDLVLDKYKDIKPIEKSALLDLKSGIIDSYNNVIGVEERRKFHHDIENVYMDKDHTLEEIFPDIFNSLK